jgi:monovalent cation:H+ antiporter-2, CPA2 family
VEPFKGLLLGLFFIAVGASIDFGLLVQSPVRILGLVAAVILVKLAVLLVVARAGKLSRSHSLVFAVVLSQVGEFAFVLFGYCAQNGILPTSITGPMIAVTAFSMACTPLLLTGLERFVLPRIGANQQVDRQPDAIDEQNPVIVAGYGRFGQIAGRMLRAYGVGVTVLEIDSDQVEMLQKFGQKTFFGDASRLELLHAAGAHEAKLLLVAVDDPEKVLEIVTTARKHFPNLAILARARGRTEAYELHDLGVEGFYRETFETAVKAGEDALRLLGLPAYAAHRAARTFRHADEQGLRELAAHRHDQAMLVSKVRERMKDFEQLMQSETRGPIAGTSGDHGWESRSARGSSPRTPSAARRRGRRPRARGPRSRTAGRRPRRPARTSTASPPRTRRRRCGPR